MTKRVLILGSYAPSLLNFRGALIALLVKVGYEVHVCAPDLTGETSASLEALGAKNHSIALERAGRNPLKDFNYLWALIRLIRRVNPDLVLTYTIKPNIWGSLAAAACHIRSAAIITGLGYAFTQTSKGGLKSWIFRAQVRVLYRSSTSLNWRVIFQNRDDRNDFISAGCLGDVTKIRMMNGSGVDLAHFAPQPLPGLPDFLMISRLLCAKGVREYARAALAVKKIYPGARFRLVGYFDEGPDGIPPEEIREWSLGGLEYLGPSADVRPHLADCKVFVLPSYREGTPRSVLEAMAVGRAILTSDAPGCRETVVDGVNGFLVPVRDESALAEKMRWFIENPDACQKMGVESLRLVREKYDVHKVNAVLMQNLELG